MNLLKALRLSSLPTVAFTGAGGKTTATFTLARQFEGSVVVTTTTHLSTAQIELADHHFIWKGGRDFAMPKDGFPTGVILVTGEKISGDRVGGLTTIDSLALKEIAEANGAPLLIEADGSRMRPLKAPGPHEPVIPVFVDTVVVCAGMSALGQLLTNEWVHRPQRFAELSGAKEGEIIPPEALVRALTHPEGGLKGAGSAHRVVLLNQADTHDLRAATASMAPRLLSAYHGVIAASLRENTIHAVHESIAGIVLAAGEGTRMGRAKQLLLWKGKPLVRHVAETALAAGLSPVVVVTGAHDEAVKDALKGRQVVLVYNEDWAVGQSSSVKRGLENLKDKVGGAVFLLADQPQIPVPLVRGLVERHAETLAPVVAPLIDGQRGNPVLFDRDTFDDFVDLSGDKGGRQLFSRYRVDWVPWHDDRPLSDVDTPEDYDRLLSHD